MKNIFTFFFISISVACLAQNKKELIVSAKKAIDDGKVKSVTIAGQTQPLEKIILFSKGEAFTEKEWQEYRKQVYPIVKEFFKRDSAHNKFLGNTVSPHLIAGDTIANYSVTLEGIFIKLKTKKK